MTAQFNPFAHVSGRFGAPMGRHGGNPSNLIGVKRLFCRYQGGDEGYDKGGAYWGAPSDVYGVWAKIDNEIICAYVRAESRATAISMVRGGY